MARFPILLLAALSGVASVSVNDPVQLWSCIGTSNQEWRYYPAGQGPLSNRVVAVATQSLTDTDAATQVLVWDLSSSSPVAKTALHVNYFKNKTQVTTQSFSFEENTGLIHSLLDPKLCVAQPPGITDGTPFSLLPCFHTDPSQIFTLDPTQNTIKLVHPFYNDLCVDAGTNVSCSEAPFSTYAYCNFELSPEVRAADLSARLTARDLAALLQNANPGVPRFGLPGIHYGEALHGFVTHCQPYYDNATGTNSTGCPSSFPHAMVLGASFNRSLWHLVASAISTEGRAIYNYHNHATHLITWAPDINPIRDPRWGRSVEVTGEDAQCLMAEYIYQYARGLQEGEDLRYIKLVSTAKHFSAYDMEDGYDSSGTYWLRTNFTAYITRKDAVEYYWAPFLSAVQRGGVASVMCSYNAIRVCDDPLTCNFSDINGTGIPSCADADLLTGMLRDQWGAGDEFFVVSDCGAISQMEKTRNYAANISQAAGDGLNAGTDVNCGPGFASGLQSAIVQGFVLLATAQRAANRLLQVAFATGMFDPPNATIYNQYGASLVDSPAHRQLAFEAAQQGQILLRNNNTTTPWGSNMPLLPLRAKSFNSVAIVGPNANATQVLLGNYVGSNTLVNSHSILQALQARGQADGFAVHYEPGCINASVYCPTNDGFAEAVAAVRQAQLAIVVVGLCSNCPDGTRAEGEGHDRFNITLPGLQEQLIQEVAATGVPTVVVLVHGGVLAMEWTFEHMPAILDSHYSGELGGDAVVSVLFGDVSPSGRVTTTYYPADIVNQRPITDMQLAPHGKAPGLTYMYYTGPVLFPFGWGLSYTTFSYQWLSSAVEQPRIMGTDELVAGPPVYAVNVTNTGTVASAVVALAFVASGIPGEPLQKLFDFQRCALLSPGASVVLDFTLAPLLVARVGQDGTVVLTPGSYAVRIGDVAAGNHASTELHLRGAPVRLPLNTVYGGRAPPAWMRRK